MAVIALASWCIKRVTWRTHRRPRAYRQNTGHATRPSPTGIAERQGSAARYPADAPCSVSGRAARGPGRSSEPRRQDRRLRRPLLDPPHVRIAPRCCHRLCFTCASGGTSRTITGTHSSSTHGRGRIGTWAIAFGRKEMPDDRQVRTRPACAIGQHPVVLRLRFVAIAITTSRRTDEQKRSRKDM